MINHFRTWLLNRPASFFSDSLFSVFTDPEFLPSPREVWSLEIDRLLFGEEPDASLADYRYFQFLRIVDGCGFQDHVRRYDPRETYRSDRYDWNNDSLFESSVTPSQGLTLTENPMIRPEFLRRTFTVLFDPERGRPPTVLWSDGCVNSLNLPTISNSAFRIDSLGLAVTATRPGSWRVDYRTRPRRTVEEIVRSVLDLPVTVLRSLFERIKEAAPQYEEGFRTITDSLSRFCMVLFAQAIANELMRDRWDLGEKRIERDANELSLDAEGSFYFGSSRKDLLRPAEIKNELQCLSAVRTRRQTVEVTVPEMGFLYLVWPVRFGLPARNRIIVDGMLNSAWSISYVDDREEQYVVFRSEYKIRTDSTVRIEVP